MWWVLPGFQGWVGSLWGAPDWGFRLTRRVPMPSPCSFARPMVRARDISNHPRDNLCHLCPVSAFSISTVAATLLSQL